MQEAYLGAIIGRYAGRVADANFSLANTDNVLSMNYQQHALHGGIDNFSYRLWELKAQTSESVTFAIHSHDGDQGFNGELNATVTYTLSDDSVVIDYSADCDQTSVCSLSSQAYFNLDGHGDVRQHSLCIPSQQYLPIDGEGIPNATLASVADTPFDFSKKHTVMTYFERLKNSGPTGGYDHDWYFGQNGVQKPLCQLWSADERVSLALESTQPALHLYTGNELAADTPDNNNEEYDNFAGLVLRTGCLANSPNTIDFINDCLIAPNKPYRHRSVYRLSWS